MEVRGGGKLQQNIWLETSEKVKHNISSIISIFKEMTCKRKWNLSSRDLVSKNAYTNTWVNLNLLFNFLALQVPHW